MFMQRTSSFNPTSQRDGCPYPHFCDPSLQNGSIEEAISGIQTETITHYSYADDATEMNALQTRDFRK
jgi:hypothetical protein